MTFYYPYLLLLTIIPVIFLWIDFSHKNDAFSKYFSKEMQHKLSLNASKFSTRYKRFVFIAILILFIVALARPAKLLPTLENKENQPALIIALDVSKSMHEKDIYPTRLTLAMKKLKDLLSQATMLQIGVILYAKEAYMLYPITKESSLLAELLNDVNLSTKFAPNSNLFAALEASESLLRDHNSKQILLLSDGGAEVSRDEELEYLKKKHITLYALTTTTTSHASIDKLCQNSGGISTHYTLSTYDIDALLSHIKSHPDKAETFHYDFRHYQELYVYPLWLAICLLILLFLPLRRVTFLLVFTVLFMPHASTPLHAGILDFWHLHKAKAYAEEKAYTDAITNYNKLTPTPQIYYNIATMHYRNKAYLLAIATYKKALGKEKSYNAKIYYNIATAYVQLHKLAHAKEYYLKSFALYPLKETKENLLQVTQALKAERKNLHKAYQKLHFKAIAKNSFTKEAIFSNYAVKLEKLIPSEEEQWFKRIAKQKFQPYLEHIPTSKRSLDANLSF